MHGLNHSLLSRRRKKVAVITAKIDVVKIIRETLLASHLL